ncbi:lamin tail domain-containing protein [bacterium]|nr:lamin tail domain-containing protein [bacterium]
MKNNNPRRLKTIAAACLGLFSASSPILAEQVIFTEIQYNARSGQPEFIELTNNTATPFDTAKWFFSDGINYTFPDFDSGNSDAHILKDFETILISPVPPADLRSAYPNIPASTRIFGPYTGGLSNSGETLTLSDKNGVIMTTVDYNDGGKWPAAADGSGHTLTRINPNLSNRDWRNWRSSAQPGGTPGFQEPEASAAALVISEVHFDDSGDADWIELHAPGTSSVVASDYNLSISRSLSNPATLSGTVPAGGYQSFPVNFTPDDNGDLDLFLAQGSTVIGAIRLDRDLGEESFQSFPVGVEFYGGPGSTRDAPNNPVSRQTAIVINEIMFDAPSDQGNAEFIELYNRGSEGVDLSGWKIADGVSFDFPVGTTLAPGAYLVIAADKEYFSRAYPGVVALGDWSGTLRDRGELLRIEDQSGNLVDEVDYLPEGDWPNLADGDGSSMELRHPDMDNTIATAWADSDESQKSEMETFTYTGEFLRSKFLPLTSGQELHTHLVGDAHVILENISVTLDDTGDNLLRNPGVMSPTDSSSLGWVTQGTHWASFMTDGKLNLIADGHGDSKTNRGEVDFAANPIVGQSYTLSFDGRWVSGKSRVIFQTLDHGFGTTFSLPIPENLGTPGAPNSAALASAAPTVVGVIHNPPVPSASEAVTVTARIDSAAALTAVELVYRLDIASGNGTWIRTPMTDDGTGLFSANVNQFTTEGNIIEFYVEATAGNSTTTQPVFGADRPALWIVDSRTMPGILLQERFILSQNDQRAMTTTIGGSSEFDYNYAKTSNRFYNATFISNESEIFYNAEIRKSGSPFTRSDNATIDHGKWKLPGDRLFRGRRRHVIDASGTPEGSGTPRFYDDRMGRYFLYQLGHPINEMEFTNTVVNSNGFKLRESQEPISNDFLNRNFSDGSSGTLLRIDDQWRITTDTATSTARPSAKNADWTYKDTDNPIAYHNEWLMRTRESDYDYGSFIELTRLLDEDRTDEATLERTTNPDMLALMATVRGYDADWDSITLDRGKNGYFFRPKEGDGWMLLHWDGDRVFDISGRANQPILGSILGVRDYFRTPLVQRHMNYYMTKLLDEHTKGSLQTAAWMQAETNAVAGTGVTMTASHYTSWFDVRESTARSFIGSDVADTAFTVTTPPTTTAEDVIGLTGTAPPTIFSVNVVDQLNTVFTWTSETTWTLEGIVLREGQNPLIIEGYDHEGNLVEQLEFNIAKTGNANPVIAVESSPRSRNLALGETLTLDASESFDPDADDLVFNWQVTPSNGVTLNPADRLLTADFSDPGFYLITVTASDPNSNSTTRTVGVSVHLENDFSNFGDPDLESFWTTFNAEEHGNSANGPYYSLQDHEGRLTLNTPFSRLSLGLPPPALPPAENYVQTTSVWTYDDSNQELTGIFAQPNYDDSSWASGPGFFGFNERNLPDPGLQTGDLRSDRANNLITYYFRTEFEFDKMPAGAQLRISHYADDGVRYYLNGQVLGSIRLPDGEIDSNTTGTGLVETGLLEEDVLVLDVSSAIVSGTNVFAAEVHNSSAGNSDLAFGAKVDIAAYPLQAELPELDTVTHPWIRRALPEGNWILQTEVKLEKSQFGQFYAGLLVQADQEGTAFRYGVGFKDGDSIASIRLNPSGSVEALSSVPALDSDTAVVRLERRGDLLTFSWLQDDQFTTIDQLTLPADTSFDLGGVFSSTEIEQTLEVSFDYAMLISSSADFTSWMNLNGLGDPDAEYENSGLSNLLAYALGRDLTPNVSPALIRDGNFIGFSHRQRINGGQINYQVEKSSDLVNWESAGDLSPDGAPSQNPDGTFTVNLLSDIPVTEQATTYYRLVVSLQ